MIEKKAGLWWFFVILLIASSLSVISLGKASSVGTRIYLDPSISTANPGQQFTVKVSVAEVTDLWAWDFVLRWNSTILAAVEPVTEGSFLNQEGTYDTVFIGRIDNERGAINATATLLRPAQAASGNGVLAVITFSVKMEGKTALHIVPALSLEEFGTMLVMMIDSTPILIEATFEDGYFAYPLPKVYVHPSSIVNPAISPDSNLTISINVSKASGVYAWQFFFYWNPSVLDLASVIESTFLNQAGTQPTTFHSEINQTGGYVYVNCTLVGDVPTASGNGTLAILNFRVKLRGTTILNLDKTKMFDVYGEFIPQISEDGYFNNAAHDVAVTNIKAYPTTVKAGESVSINATVKNVGAMTENFTVTVSTPSPTYINIGTQTVTNLEPGQEKTLTFSWNTGGVAEGDYALRAEASQVSEEVYIQKQNNVFDMIGKVKVTSAGLPLSTVLIIGAAVAVVAIGIVAFVYARRRHKS